LDKNILDKATDKLLSTLNIQDEKAKNANYYPFGTEKATAKEKQEAFNNMDIAGLSKMLQEQGQEATNAYLKKYMGGDRNGMV